MESPAPTSRRRILLDGVLTPLDTLPDELQQEWRQYFTARNEVCPRCQRRGALFVQWGLPEPEYFLTEHPPHIEAGCVLISDPPPNRYCDACGHQWVQPVPVEAADTSAQAEDTDRITFLVRHPWGASFVDGVQVILDALGVATAENPLAEGVGVGLFVATDADALAAGLALAEQEAESAVDLDNDEFWQWLYDLYERLRAMGVYGVEYDVRHWSWNENPFSEVGVELVLRAEVVLEADRVFEFEAWRDPAV